ncbi:MFS general substrate transporter [Gymnopus androsaceus JB14]|uniref:MFS general substrate transporter n=1 Tax=Gymnopus androsaceus JB14 TaxID=1447944 RepID=A0A6A4HLG7_9AGAR|nr:MFS general substrate transporter [Gymnopus androsaceus JB14]
MSSVRSAAVDQGETAPVEPESLGPQLTDQTNLLPRRQVITVLLALSLCSLVTTLDQVIVSASLSTISAAFNAGSISAWIPAAYLLTSTAFQPLYGPGFSQSITQLIVFRVIAGIGDGGATSMVQIVISDVLSLRDRGKFIGYASAVIAAGYTIGPIIGGALAQHVSWRWAFWITLPVALCATLGVVFALPLKPVQGNIRSKLLMIDYVGVLLTLGACTMIMLPLVWGGVTFPWNSAIVLGPLCAGIVAIGIFCVWETKAAKLPLVPMYIFRHMTVVGVYICMFVNGFVFFSMLFYLPQFFQIIHGYSPTRAGIFIIPFDVIGIFASIGAVCSLAKYYSAMAYDSYMYGICVSRTGKYRFIIYSGFALFSIACGCISIFTAQTSRTVMVVLMLLAGLGGGVTSQTTTVAAQASVARRDMAVVSAVRNFLRMLGGALALPASAALLNNAMRKSMEALSLSSSTIASLLGNWHFCTSKQATSSVMATTKGFKDVFYLNASLTTLAFVAAVVLIKHKELLRGDEGKLKMEAKEALRTKGVEAIATSSAIAPDVKEVNGGDIEMGAVVSDSRTS